MFRAQKSNLLSIKDNNANYHYVMCEIDKPKQNIPILVKEEEEYIQGQLALS